MKIRTDFVTNSSSSSFVIARKSEFSEKQKEVILKYAEEHMFGDKIASTKAELDEYYKDEYGEDYSGYELGMDPDEYDDGHFDEYVQALEAINNGLAVYKGWVSSEYEDTLADFLRDIWGKLEEADDTSFVGIDTDLEY